MRPDPSEKVELPPIPAKRYFTIGEVSDLCAVKPHVLRYWEQEFVQLRPMKRRGNRRYYQHHEVLLIRRIRELLYEQGYTISGARNRLDSVSLAGAEFGDEAVDLEDDFAGDGEEMMEAEAPVVDLASARRELEAALAYLGGKEPASPTTASLL